MGWDFTRGATRESVIRELTAERSDWVPMEHRVTGDGLYVRVLRPKTEESFIVLYLLKAERGYGYGYKGMDEASQPYYYECPLALLERPVVLRDEEAMRLANEWRANVRAWHALKASLKPGKVLHPRNYPVWTMDGSEAPENYAEITLSSAKPLVGRITHVDGRVMGGGKLYRIPKPALYACLRGPDVTALPSAQATLSL